MNRRTKMIVSLVLSLISLAAVAATSPPTEVHIGQG